MEEITQKEAETIIIEKDKVTTIEKIEPVEDNSTSSKIIQDTNKIIINS